MDILPYFFSKENVVLIVGDYQMSWIELLATIFNLLAVWLSAREKVSNWWIGLIGISLFMCLSYQVRLYADVFLQLFFFASNCVGWYNWTRPVLQVGDVKKTLSISALGHFQRIILLSAVLVCTIFLGFFFLRIHLYYPTYFPQPAAFPFADSLIMAGSIFAQLLLIEKKIESWLLWILVNCTAIFVYAQREIYLTSLLYAMFLLISIKGLREWQLSIKKSM
jgi:nicotinamide mononucleotide transporter